MILGNIVKFTSPYSWNQYFDQENHFTVHLYTKSLKDQTPKISSFHSKLLGSFQNKIRRLNNEQNNPSQYNIILDEAIEETCVLDFIELLKTGNLKMNSKNEMENLNFLLSVFGLTATLDSQEKVLEYEEENLFHEAAINFQENNDDLEESEFHEAFQEVFLPTVEDHSNTILTIQTSDKMKQQPNMEKPQKVDKTNSIATREKESMPIKMVKENHPLKVAKQPTKNQPTIDSANFRETRDIIVSNLKISTKALKCRLCRKNFQQTYQMVKHLMDVHGYSKNMSETALQIWLSLGCQENQDGAVEKQMRCNFCQKKYTDNICMKQHLTGVHFRKSIRKSARIDEQKGMMCSICNKNWKTELKWLEHFFCLHLSMQNLLNER